MPTPPWSPYRPGKPLDYRPQGVAQSHQGPGDQHIRAPLHVRLPMAITFNYDFLILHDALRYRTTAIKSISKDRIGPPLIHGALPGPRLKPQENEKETSENAGLCHPLTERWPRFEP